MPMDAHVGVDHCRCLLHPFSIADLDDFDGSLGANPGLDDMGESDDLVSLPF
jgi:hypothetical protein